MSSDNPKAPQTCPICQVSIEENGQVNFHSGLPGTRARLYARVCQYTQKPGCINQDTELIGELTKADIYEPGTNIDLSSGASKPI